MPLGSFSQPVSGGIGVAVGSGIDVGDEMGSVGVIDTDALESIELQLLKTIDIATITNK